MIELDQPATVERSSLLHYSKSISYCHVHILTHSSVANKIANKTQLPVHVVSFGAKARLPFGSIETRFQNYIKEACSVSWISIKIEIFWKTDKLEQPS